MTDYWNHNTAHHPWIKRIAARRGHSDLLDFGCGDGLLLERLAPSFRSVTGIEPDFAAIARAQRRLDTVPNATLLRTGFAEYEPDREDRVGELNPSAQHHR